MQLHACFLTTTDHKYNRHKLYNTSMLAAGMATWGAYSGTWHLSEHLENEDLGTKRLVDKYLRMVARSR